MKIYSIYDKKALCYNTPFAQTNHEVAKRTFNSLCTDPESHISNYPGDFELIYIGEFDNNTGKMELEESLNSIANGNVFVVK